MLDVKDNARVRRVHHRGDSKATLHEASKGSMEGSTTDSATPVAKF